MMKYSRHYSIYSVFNLIIILFGTGILGTASICVAQGTWTQKADIPTSRWYLSSCAVNGKIYAIGGVGGYQTVEKYDPATDTWETKAPMPTGRGFLATSEVNGKIYAIGGAILFGTGIAATEEYDPATDTWTPKTPMPTPRSGFCAGVVDGKIYVIGGQDGDIVYKKVEVYDPVTDSWTTKQDMPTARWAPTCGVVNGKIYVFGGIVNANSGAGLNVVEMYDPATDAWNQKADMPGRRLGHATAIVYGQVYIFGGTTSGGGLPPYSTLWAYDPQTDTWDTSLPDMPFNWFIMGYTVVNERVYIMAGSKVSYPHGDRPKMVYVYDPLATGIEDISSAFPGEFLLHQNYPNPFNPETRIQYELPQASKVVLRIFNLKGQQVQTLVQEFKAAGDHSVVWDGRDNSGREMVTGTYLYKLETNTFKQVRKMVLLR